MQRAELFDSPGASQKGHFARNRAGRSRHQEHPDLSSLPLFCLALTLVKKADHPYPHPQTPKNTSEFAVPVCISLWGVMGWREEAWESSGPGCSAERLTGASLLDRQKMLLCCQSKSWSGAV